MTVIIDHSANRPGRRTMAVTSAALDWLNAVSERARAKRRTRREHEQLMAMSSYELHDIGMTRGEVAFGISTGRGVFRDADG